MTMAAEFLKKHGLGLQPELSKVQFGKQGAAELDAIASSSVNLQQGAVPLELIRNIEEVRSIPNRTLHRSQQTGRRLTAG